MVISLSDPLELPCGAILPNRIVKAAMSEGMADKCNRATQRLEALYRRWSGSGAGLLLSGNIQVDREHLERPLNVVLDNESGLEALKRMVAAGKSGGARFWAEISHTGRQVVSEINPAPLAPSMVDVEVMRGIGYTFSPPRAMTTAQIHHAIGQFAQTAELAKRAGFDGVELHGAHGYLISQFLSPRTNLRKDEWGGNIGNRARFLVEVLAAVRAAVGPEFPVGLKLNATDFQKGGFTNAECIEVVRRLNSTSLDLLELSGGSLEQPKMMGVALKDEGEDGLMASSCRSEAYFLGFAADIRKVATMPIMVTGGFRTLRGMEDALHGGQLDLVGIGRPMLVDPDVPRKLLSGEMQEAPKPEAHLEMFHHMPWLNMQIERMGDGLEPDPTMDGADAAACFVALESANLETLLGARAALGVA